MSKTCFLKEHFYKFKSVFISVLLIGLYMKIDCLPIPDIIDI